MIPFDAFLDNDYLGQGLADHNLSFHYLCPVCGTIWARVLSAGPTSHGALHIPCPQHERPFQFPPTIVQDFRFYNVRWPKDVLVRDFLYLTDPENRPVYSA